MTTPSSDEVRAEYGLDLLIAVARESQVFPLQTLVEVILDSLVEKERDPAMRQALLAVMLAMAARRLAAQG